MCMYSLHGRSVDVSATLSRCWDHKETGSTASGGMGFPARGEQAGKE